ncbi:PEBP-like protein [Fomitopsis serialis]|uniref:PEBP-like protein n=1 Tax=Fomitopsis serialis TaxID=139415 RepID=UPI002008ABFF|nr:PEBP-like protein [Neoantrodia serialis]KAH9921345.1 PEBP-like protein [Neoantrodia serialis]
MLAVRRLPRACARLSGSRGNASLQPTDAPANSVTPPPSPPRAAAPAPKSAPAPSPSKAGSEATGTETAAEGTKQNGRNWPTHRPRISLEHPRQWNRPLAKGVLPVYDLALQYIEEDSKALKVELEEVRKALQAAETAGDVQRGQELSEKARIIEIQSEVNLPDVRWKTMNGMADMSQLSYRHLSEKRWREDGVLDLLMERIHQMNVVPDLLADLRPTIDLRLNFPEPPPEDTYRRTRVKRRYQKVEPGIYLLPEQTWRPPMLYTTVWHTDTRLYTLFMVDLDVPNEATQSFQAYLHWMQPNIPLSAFSTSPISIPHPHTHYIPPHPQQGTPYHRYAVLMLPQASPTEPLKLPKISEAARLGFNFRTFAEEHGFDGSKGGGAHMWREVWDETVSKIYRDVLKTDEPRYKRPARMDPYVEVKTGKKYI